MRSSKQISKPAARVGWHSELGAAASRKAISWDLRLASLLTHLLVSSLVFLGDRLQNGAPYAIAPLSVCL